MKMIVSERALHFHQINYIVINPYPVKVIYLNFHPLEVESRYRDPQL